MIRFIIILGCAATLLATFNLILIGKYLYCIISYILGALLWGIFVGSGPYGGLFVKGRPWALYLFWPLEALFRIYQRYWLLYKNHERFMVSYKTYDRNDREYLKFKNLDEAINFARNKALETGDKLILTDTARFKYYPLDGWQEARYFVEPDGKIVDYLDMQKEMSNFFRN